MSANGATVHGESYVYGGVLFQRVTEGDSEKRSHRTGIGACLSQGVFTGTILIFLLAVYSVLLSSPNGSSPNEYSLLILVFFPTLLSCGLVAGLIEGLVIGICAKAAGHDLRWFTRVIIGALAFSIPCAVLLFVFSSDHNLDTTLADNLRVAGIMGGIGATFGLLTGSRFNLWRELVRGVEGIPRQSWFLTGLSGLVLRVSIALFLMESILLLIIGLHNNSQRSDFVVGLVLLLHFIAAAVIAFGRFRFQLLLPLALAINVPIATQINYVLTEFHVIVLYLYVGYLSAWAAFLIARSLLTYRALAFINEEIRYYLID